MKKIVIISRRGEVNLELIALATALFPECDISIAAADIQDLEPYPEGSFSKTGVQDETRTSSCQKFYCWVNNRNFGPF